MPTEARSPDFVRPSFADPHSGRIVLLADDLTGACDAGAAFLRTGRTSFAPSSSATMRCFGCAAARRASRSAASTRTLANTAFLGGRTLKSSFPRLLKPASSASIAPAPHSPDTIFVRALRGEFDLIVAMYHDQGHIPMKLIDFEGGVNVSLGLPIIRTSVDHGTAFDIAGHNQADATNMKAAMRLAVRMAEGKLALSGESAGTSADGSIPDRVHSRGARLVPAKKPI